jgi:hypothetical protein
VNWHPASQWKGLRIIAMPDCMACYMIKLDQGIGQHDGIGHTFGCWAFNALRVEVMRMGFITATLYLCASPS